MLARGSDPPDAPGASRRLSGKPPGPSRGARDRRRAGARSGPGHRRGRDGPCGDGTISGVDLAPGAGAVPGDRHTIDASGLLVTPGLVDLHTHLYRGVSHYGIEPTPTAWPGGHHGGRRWLVRRADLPRAAPLHHRAVADADPRLPAHRRPGHDHQPGRRARGPALGLAGPGDRAGPRASGRHRRHQGPARLPDGRRRPGARAAPGPRGRRHARPAADGARHRHQALAGLAAAVPGPGRHRHALLPRQRGRHPRRRRQGVS